MLNSALITKVAHGQQCELTTDEATAALFGDSKTKTILLILQKSGRLRLVVSGTVTKWLLA